MDSELVQLFDVKAVTPPRTRFATAADLAAEGDSIMGALVHWHPTVGAQDYDRNDCGVLMLLVERDQVVKIALDKGQLATAVHDAMVYLQTAAPIASKVVKVTYVGKHDKGYKLYEVRVGIIGNEAGFASWASGGPVEVQQ